MHNYNANLSRPWARVSVMASAAVLFALTGCAHAPPPTAQGGDAGTPPATAQTAPADQSTQPAQYAKPGPSVRQNLRYVVKKGDTLWDIASYFLDDPWDWPDLWYVNSDIHNPHLIYPGEVLHLVHVNGKPRLKVTRLQPQVRKQSLSGAIPTIPLDAIKQFLNGPRVVSKDTLDNAPYIVEFLDKHLLGASGTTAYVRHAHPQDGNAYSVVHPGPPYRDPQTNEILGYKAVPVGRITIGDFDTLSTGVLEKSTHGARTGDRLLPREDKSLAFDFHPHPPDHKVNAQIIAVFGGALDIGQYQIVTLDRGARNTMKRGDVLDVYQRGALTQDPVTGKTLRLPTVKAGTLMVFKVEDRISYGLIMASTRAIHILDSARNPSL